MQQLGAQDAQFLYMENTCNLSNVQMVSLYAPLVGSAFDAVKNHVATRLDASPIFKRKLQRVPLDLDFPYWVDDDYFDFDAHLFSHHLPAPGDWQQLSQLLGRLHSRSLDMNRPVWEMHVIEGLDAIADVPKGSFAVVTKVHHAVVDGAAMVKFFTCLSDIDAAGTPAADISVAASKAGAPASSSEVFKNGLKNLAQSPLKMGKTLYRSAPVIVPAAIDAMRSSDETEEKTEVPTTRLNQPVSPHKTFNGVAFDLADLKRVQQAVDGAKINDVILAISSGAIRRYLQYYDELPAESLVAWVPINARPMKGDKQEGNKVAVMTTAVGTNIAQPLARLKEITRQTQLSKAAKSGLSARVMADVSQDLPGATMAVASRLIVNSGMVAKLCNYSVSNVPGPNIPMYMAGAECLYQYGMVPLGEGMGLFIVALSYNGKLTLTVTTTKEVMPDTDRFCEFMIEAFEELKAAAAPLKAVKKPAKQAVKKAPKKAAVKRSKK